MRDEGRRMRKIIWWGLAGVLIFTPLARGAVRVWSITPVLLVIYSLIFLRLLFRKSFTSGTVPSNALGSVPFGDRPYNRITVPIIAFAALAVISFAFSIYKHDSFYALLRLFAYIGVYFLIVNNFDRQMFRRLLGLVILIGTGLSVYGFLQYFAGLGHSWWVPKNFLAATYVNHNHFAGYLELVIPLTIGMLMRREKIRQGSGIVPSGEQKSAMAGTAPSYKKLFLISALIVMAVVFIFTQSRGAWLSLTISLFIMNIILVKRKRLNKLSLFVSLLMLGIIFSFICLNRGEITGRIATISGIEEIESEPSLKSRMKIWQGAVGIIRDNPLIGVGIGDFDWGFYRYRLQGFNMRAVYAHNDYLHMAAEMGIFAPLIMLWLFFTAIIMVFKQNSGSILLGCATGILSLSLHGLADFNFHIPANMILFTIWMAVASSRT